MAFERLVLTDCTFDKGGSSQDYLSFIGDGTPFDGNGAAVSISGNATGTIDYVEFEACSAVNGGAISIEAGDSSGVPDVTLNEFDIRGAKASGNGGAIYVSVGTLTLSNGMFRGRYDTATVGYGGAIFATGANTTLTIDSTDFNGCQASQGGALYLQGIDSCTITDSRFITYTDSIYVEGACQVTFAGVNALAASVTVDNSENYSAVRTADGAKLIFCNTSGITFDGTLGANNTIELNNGAVVTMTNGINPDAAIIVNNGVGTSLVGEAVDILKADGLNSDMHVIYKGIEDKISNHEGLVLNADNNTLSASVTFYGRVVAENVNYDDTMVQFAETESVYSESFTEVVVGGEKVVVGDSANDLWGDTIVNPEKYVINGDIFAADNSFSMSNLTYGGHIYGGRKIDGPNEVENTSCLTLSGIALSSTTVLKINGGGLISAPTTTNDAATQVVSGGSQLEIGLVGKKKAGTIFGGADIVSEGIVYNAGEIKTTINGGYFGKIVGNGSRGNYGGEIYQGASTLTITDGTFYGRVYAGGYAASSAANEDASMAVSEILGDVSLKISGGTFKGYVYGGSCAQYDYLADHNTHITGDVTVTIDSRENLIKFNAAVFAGSQSEGKITGNTKVVFKGLGENLDFSDCADGVGRIYGGSQNEKDFADVTREGYAKYVSGERSLVFDGFTGTISADFFNFDTVTFYDSEVTLDAYTDLHLVDTWNFDVSSNAVNLNWNADVADNSFAGDTINLKGWDGETTCIFMTGSEAALRQFNLATVNVYDGVGTQIVSGFEVSKVNGGLQIAKA